MVATLLAVISVLSASAAAAQQWDTPTFFAPSPADDVGLYVTKADPFADVGLVGIWRQTGNIDMGVRAGVASVAENDRGVLLGAEITGPIRLPVGSTILIHWMTGAGAVFDGVTLLRIPVGASFGIDLTESMGVGLIPYAHPRVALDIVVIGENEAETTDTEFSFDLDLGAQLSLGGSFLLRFAATIGDLDSIGAGLAYRIPRGVVVR